MPEIEDLLSWTEKPKFPIVTWEANLCTRSTTAIGKKFIDRVQLQVSPSDYCMLIRHITELHWCGYVLVHPLVWAKIESFVRAETPVPVTHAGPQSKYIAWMLPTTAGKLSQPTTLLSGLSEDFWVGFSLRGMDQLGGADESPDKALAVLQRFYLTVANGIQKLVA